MHILSTYITYLKRLQGHIRLGGEDPSPLGKKTLDEVGQPSSE